MTQTSKNLATNDVAYPVELLRDRKGVYGIGTTKEADVEEPTVRILLRPDRLDEEPCPGGFHRKAIYQMITGGFRHGMFSHTPEEGIRQAIHHAMLRRAGLCWPPIESPEIRYWSRDNKKQTRNRQIFHGLRLGSLGVVNRLIREALAEAAVPEAVTQARRFRFGHRQTIYETGARSRRALQIIEAFPVLALAIYCDPRGRDLPGIRSPIPTEQRIVAAGLVERGASLRKIADLMDVPMALRRVKPGAADAALFAVGSHVLADELIHAHMPESLPQMKAWLGATAIASRTGSDFVEWTAKHALEIAGRREEILSFLDDIADWVRASRRACVPTQDLRAALDDPFPRVRSHGEEFVTRPFCSDMSLKTVKRLSHDWHEAVANNMDGPNQLFPDPWCEGGLVADYEILPITNSADLYREGRAMHHCVGAYSEEVRQGNAYFYSVRKDGDRIATVELIRNNPCARLGQIRGMCNSVVGDEIKRAVRKWIRAQKGFRFPRSSEVSKLLTAVGEDQNDNPCLPIFDTGEIPF
jgi:hypothetical protein